MELRALATKTPCPVSVLLDLSSWPPVGALESKSWVASAILLLKPIVLPRRTLCHLGVPPAGLDSGWRESYWCNFKKRVCLARVLKPQRSLRHCCLEGRKVALTRARRGALPRWGGALPRWGGALLLTIKERLCWHILPPESRSHRQRLKITTLPQQIYPKGGLS